MRLVCVPPELTPPHLAALRETPAPLAAQLREAVMRKLDSGHTDDALTTAAQVFFVAQRSGEQHTAALALLYKAEVLRRLQRWEEALMHAHKASLWLRAEVTQVAAYNYAVALCFEGLIHFVLRADDKTMQTFAAAQSALAESERFWGFENNLVRVVNCQSMGRWMSKLLTLLPRTPPGEWMVIVPVYEWVHEALAFIDVMPITPFQFQPPREALREYLPANYIPVETEALPFLQLRPDTHYLALKIPRDGDLVQYSQAGDILLIEAASPIPPREVALTRDEPFVRHTDGRVDFGPYGQQSEAFTGIPRILIRQEEENL